MEIGIHCDHVIVKRNGNVKVLTMSATEILELIKTIREEKDSYRVTLMDRSIDDVKIVGMEELSTSQLSTLCNIIGEPKLTVLPDVSTSKIVSITVKHADGRVARHEINT
jgi:hypothetical protein